jgi:hypothetical protein
MVFLILAVLLFKIDHAASLLLVMLSVALVEGD